MAYVCCLCGISFQQDGYLHWHRIHSTSKTCRKCIYCDYTFLNKCSKQIRKHMISEHSDVSCGKCQKEFFLTVGLAYHTRDVHDGETCLSQATHSTRFLSDLQSSGNSLKRLLDEKVKLDPDKVRRCKEIVHHLVNFMQHNLGEWFGVSEVVKGGSLGKGTSIREKVDIDLVVFMNRFKSVADLQQQHQEVLRRLKDHILRDFTFAKQIHYSYDTSHSNMFSLRTDGGKDLIEVDLLPACDIGGGSVSTIRKMAGLSEEARSYYSVSLVKDQVHFTKDKPESVNGVIQLVKHWKARESLKIPSYAVEIITIKEWMRMDSPREVDLTQLFRRTMKELSKMNNIDITWSNSRYTGNRPIVMDPANPFNNTASLIDPSDQEDIEQKAQEVVSWL